MREGGRVRGWAGGCAVCAVGRAGRRAGVCMGFCASVWAGGRIPVEHVHGSLPVCEYRDLIGIETAAS
jgi:hypothetical protein